MASISTPTSAPLHSHARRASGDYSAGAGDSTLVAADGRALAATWTVPPAGTALRAVAVVSSATGVPRGFYRGFAQFLALRGYEVLSYDYRGIAGSLRGRVAHENATMADWARLDVSAALAAAEVQRQVRGNGHRLPLLLVGHSFGGNMVAFADGVERADALLAVGSQFGEARLFPGIHRVKAEVFFRLLLPLLVGLHGYLPAWVLGGGGAQPLPPHAARQWAAWGKRRGWAFADPALAPFKAASALNVPVHLWDVSDDLTFGPPRAVDALAAEFRNAALARHTLTPAMAGVRRLGHFGAFRRDAGARAWPLLLDTIEAATPALRQHG